MDTASSKFKAPAAFIIVATLALASLAFSGDVMAQATGTLSGTVLSASASTTTSSTTPSGGTATSTDLAVLQGRISSLESTVAALQSELSALRAQFQAFLAGQGSTTPSGGSTGGSTGGTTATSSASVTMYPQNASIRSGTNVDFNGRGFWGDEQVTVYRGGQIVGTARADSGGNFSTGSLSVGSTLGSQTYTFKGGWSGLSGTSVIQVVP